MYPQGPWVARYPLTGMSRETKPPSRRPTRVSSDVPRPTGGKPVRGVGRFHAASAKDPSPLSLSLRKCGSSFASVREEHLTVAEAALELGTSPQTVRTMLRKGQLQGRKRPWGSRYVWDVSADGLDDFLAEFGRLDGGRRAPRAVAAPVPDGEALPQVSPDTDAGSAAAPVATVTPDWFEELSEPASVDGRPFILRPRGRATVMSVALGVPLAAAYVVAQALPGALWFHELGQDDVFRRMLVTQVEFRLIVFVPIALFMAGNLQLACRGISTTYRRAALLAVAVTSFVVGGMFASAVAGHWQVFLLWRHRQTFGVVDPVHGRDVGFFLFSLPFELLVSHLVLWALAVVACSVALVYAGRGLLSWRTRHATFEAQLHLAVLAALFLLALAWRITLQQYLLELQQPARRNPDSFAGADYVDVHVRTPGLALLALLAVLLAVACLAAPVTARRGVRRARWLVGVPLGLLVGGVVMLGIAVPALVQRFLVDPNPLLREQPLLERSIAGTRDGMGLDKVALEPYAPAHSFSASDFARLTPRLPDVQIWDSYLLGARMRQLVTDTPYFRPEDQALDVVRVEGRRQPTVVSTRELDLAAVRDRAGTWINNRLAYTHGLGLVRFSGIDTGPDRGPRLLDSGLGVRQPRIYFGNLAGTSSLDEDAPGATRTTRPVSLARSSWVLVDTRRPEVDSASAAGSPGGPYHYTGTAGIPLASSLRRAAFAWALHSKQLLLSHDITPRSRVLLHRDVHDRLHTLAPFIQWDPSAVPMTRKGRVVFVVDGYTTSANFPFAERFDLGRARVNYARPSVRATVDAFSGRVHIYLTDPQDPLARAWADAFPSLFQPAHAMPQGIRDRLRYPSELFDAQATAYQRFHTSDPSVFVSDSDVWSRPIALSGPIEVAGGVDFDQSDEDNLRLTMRPSYAFTSPPGQPGLRLVLSTYYAPRSGQNLVGTLSGWIDRQGRSRLTAISLPRNPVTLGPAQISRLVFATPRVSNLLGLRNLEIRDLNKSSLDSVILGRPHLLFLPGGVMQIQSLYEGSRGPGAARLLGVTAYIDGRAGLGPDIDSAVRQALNEPPLVRLQRRHGPVTVGTQVTLGFQVQNAQRETVTITSAAGRERVRRRVTTGVGSVSWVPSTSGHERVRVSVLGLDGTVVTDSTTVRVVGRPPTVRLLRAPGRAVVGTPVRIPFRIRRAHHALATVSTDAGIVFSRRYDLDDGRGVVVWTPASPGRATILVRVRGHQRQIATVSFLLTVHRAESTSAPPPVELLHIPSHPTVGVPGRYAFRATECSRAVARIAGPDKNAPTWRFPCPARRAEFTWTPSAPGHYVLTVTAHVAGHVTSSQTRPITVAPAAPAATASASSSAGPSSTATP